MQRYGYEKALYFPMYSLSKHRAISSAACFSPRWQAATLMVEHLHYISPSDSLRELFTSRIVGKLESIFIQSDSFSCFACL